MRTDVPLEDLGDRTSATRRLRVWDFADEYD